MKKIVAIIMSVVMGALMVTPAMVAEPAYADGVPCQCEIKDNNGNIVGYKDGTRPETAILNGACECGSGEGIQHILNLVVEIMTVGIGILAVIGIVVVGIQYITAGGNEEQTRKAKRRIFEIIIGLFAYVVIYAVLYWLLPGFTPFSR